MPHVLRFDRFRMAVAAYLTNRSPLALVECLDVVDSHWLHVRTAWELGKRFQDCASPLIAVMRKSMGDMTSEAVPRQLALPFGPLQQRFQFSGPVALTPYALAHS